MHNFINYLTKSIQSIRKPIKKSRFNSKWISVGILIILACGPGPVDYNEFVSYFMPEAADIPMSDRRYAFSHQFFYTSDADTLYEENPSIKAWVTYCNNGVSETTVDAYFGEKNNALPTYLKRQKNNAAITYLSLVKGINKAYKPAEYSWEESAKDSIALVSLFSQAKVQLAKEKDTFLKARYAFQSIRLACMLSLYPSAIQLYEQYVEPQKSSDYINYWSQSRYAGALLNEKQDAKALYHFAQVFAKCPSRRHEADLSVRLADFNNLKELTNKALNLCKTDQEKAAVYALVAIQPEIEALPYLKELVQISSKDGFTELIMAREINKSEAYYYPENENAWYYFDSKDAANKEKAQGANAYFDNLLEFAKATANNTTIKNPAFWNTATAYISFVKKDYVASKEFLDKASTQASNNKALKEQIDFQKVLLASEQSEDLSHELEKEVMAFLKTHHQSEQFRAVNVVSKVCQLMAKKYLNTSNITSSAKSSGWLSGCSSKKESSTTPSVPYNKAKAYLINSIASYQHQTYGYDSGFITQTDQYVSDDSTSIATLQEVVKYINQPSPNEIDKQLITLTHIDNDYLQLLIGRRELDQHNYQAAADAFAKVSAKIWREEPFITYFTNNPFYLSPNNGQNENQAITPLAFAQKMIELQKKGDAYSLYLLGCGAYNTGYNGNAWLLRKRSWSVTDIDPAYSTYTNGNNQFLDTDYYTQAKAKGYFEEALAKATDPELQAKIAYSLALIERNEYDVLYTKNVPNYNGNEDYDVYEKHLNAYNQRMAEIKKSKFTKYFTMLKNKWNKTNYQALVIEECSTYQDFVGK